MRANRIVSLLLGAFLSSAASGAEPLSRAEWGAPEVEVTHAGGKWTMTGKKQKVTLDEATLAISVEAGPVKWAMAGSESDDLLVKSKGEESELRLSEAGKTEIVKYDTGYQTGVKIRLSQFRKKGTETEFDLGLVLTMGLEGKAEDLVFSIVAIEHETVVRRLDWPKEVDTRGANYSALNHVRGNLLPCDWPKEYGPYLNVPSGQGQEALIKSDKSYIQANLIETWSMSWWGFQKAKSALVVVVETPNDAGYKFRHPPGGPTVLGPRWLASLGKLAVSFRRAGMSKWLSGIAVT